MTICKNEYCNKNASFGFKENRLRIYCKKHKEEDMINVANHKCIETNCNKSAQRKTNKCIEHGGGIICNEPGCTKSSQGKNNKCKTHGGGKRCIEPGCNKSARGKYNTCVKHGGGDRCIEPGCSKSSQGKTNKCIEHGGGIICNEPGCTKSSQGKNNKCKAHGGGNRCNEPGCKKFPLSNNKCGEHGGGKRCPLCIDHIDSRLSNIKYDYYCATCFKRTFPNDERSKIIYSHTKEIIVRNFINEHFEGFIHDKPLYTHNCDCTHRRRIDHRKLIGNTILAIETDEHSHKNYDKYDEEIRYDDVYMIHSGKWIFIRFNPDGKDIDIEDKLDKLLEVIEDQIKRIERQENTDLVEIIKLFY